MNEVTEISSIKIMVGDNTNSYTHSVTIVPFK